MRLTILFFLLSFSSFAQRLDSSRYKVLRSDSFTHLKEMNSWTMSNEDIVLADSLLSSAVDYFNYNITHGMLTHQEYEEYYRVASLLYHIDTLCNKKGRLKPRLLKSLPQQEKNKIVYWHSRNDSLYEKWNSLLEKKVLIKEEDSIIVNFSWNQLRDSVDMKKYFRYYTPYLTTQGEKAIYVQCACYTIDKEDGSAVICMADCGSCLFTLLLFPDIKKYDDFFMQ